MPRARKAVPDPSLFAAALQGLEVQRQRIEDQIQQVRRLMGAKRAPRAAAKSAAEKPARKRRQLSAAARKRIAAAQKRRWAEYRKKTAAAG